ncbi:DUF5666 domain-containing protein [Ideonella paludis]|uniref:DUF5666 domain-containing protein n=1 Tax=Ideonella paludis TaxID=1233411 RepID=A0ABS5E107_9BURK|nr:DUF5666 domain-containing protein [Ideonella paludis]MBQ0937068.1 hypothetical protein [Ideonella paludis]
MDMIYRFKTSTPTTVGIAVLTALAMQACGGGGVDGGGTGGTEPPAYANGPISGFGSIIVGGVRYDDSAATVRNDDNQSLSSSDLRLGMVVAIDGKNLDRSLGTGVANSVVVSSELVGPVTASVVATGDLTVLGQPVKVTTSTVFDDRLVGGHSAITIGSVVEVYAVYDPTTGTYTASRVEPKSSASTYKVRGVVSANNTTQRTFRIGAATFTYAAGAAPAGLADGLLIRVKVGTSPDSNGYWVIASSDTSRPKPSDGVEVEVEGVIANYSSAASFTVNGIPVNASSASLSPSGSALAAGLRVEAEGKMTAGVLVATKVEVKKPESSGGDDDDGGSDDSSKEYEIKSTVQSVDTAAKTFVVKAGAQKVNYAGATFKDGTVADLKVGAKVEVKGRISSDGTVVNATEVKFDD